MRIEYFIELSQTSHQMTNGARNTYSITTFMETTNHRTLDSNQIQAKILKYTLQDGPIKLQAASFGATSARTDSISIQNEIQGKILRLASSSITQAMFLELCLGYSNQPHAALDYIYQVHTDRDENVVSSSV